MLLERHPGPMLTARRPPPVATHSTARHATPLDSTIMKRIALALAGLAALVVVLVLTRRETILAPEMNTTASADSVWYHASDVALLTTTGRPQLVEFFHPT